MYIPPAANWAKLLNHRLPCSVQFTGMVTLMSIDIAPPLAGNVLDMTSCVEVVEAPLINKALFAVKLQLVIKMFILSNPTASGGILHPMETPPDVP